jgi:hypothetical protein
MKLARMSLRTTPLCVSTFELAPLDELVPSAGYGPLVSDASATQVPLVLELLELLLEDEVEDALLEVEPVLELELDEVVPVVVPVPLEPEPPPQLARSAVAPAPPIQAIALRRATTCLEMVWRSNARPRSWSSSS